MSKYILINRIQVQNANAIAGFTWGFPAITHFLGFTHNLARKLYRTDNFSDIRIEGCAVIAHEHHVHTYRTSYDVEFIQSRNPPYLKSHDKTATPPVIEEGKMNMVVSLLIRCDGNIGNRQDSFLEWLKKTSVLQRLAGGTILDIADIEIYDLAETQNVRMVVRKLLPGFVLMDRSSYLEEHYQAELQKNPDAELLDAWLDFSAIKQKARPKSNLISKHLKEKVNNVPDKEPYSQLLEVWAAHLNKPYRPGGMPDQLKDYFDTLESSKSNEKLLLQWHSYCEPDEKIDADWEYIPKPEAGYLVPIMTGYKAISELYENSAVENTRDNETEVCFVESVHSVGEWLSTHRLRREEDFNNCLWHYHYEKNWYLCKQGQNNLIDHGYSREIDIESSGDDFS